MASEIGVQKLMHTNATQAATINSSGQLIIDDGLHVSEGGAVNTSIQQGLCKEWILMDGSGTIAIDDSLNVTSITDEGTGTYTITGTSAFSTKNFLVTECIQGNGAVTVSYNSYTKTTTTYRIGSRRIESNPTDFYDAKRVNESFFGDLA